MTLYTTIKRTATKFGISRQKLHDFSVPLLILYYRLLLKLRGRSAHGGTILTRYVLMLEKKEISLSKFDTLIQEYFKK